MNRRNFIFAAATSAAAPALFAQSWPTKPVRLLVAGPAGGSADIVARLLADSLSREWGRPVVVEPKPGAGGVLAVSDLLQSPHDGHTLLVGVNSIASEVPHIIKLRWDPLKELRPVAELARGGLVLVANPAVPANNLAELIAYAKANPGKLGYASYSAGTMSHVLGLVLNQSAGLDLAHIGYKGSTPALQDVMGGHVPLMFDGLATSLPLIRSGKLKAIAVSTPARVKQLPQVPTFAELGYPQMSAVAWIGLWCTPEVPLPVQGRVRAGGLAALADPGVHARLLEAGFEAGLPRTSDELHAELAFDSERVGRVLKEVGFKPE